VILPLLLLATITFHKDVEPILQRHCQNCHRPGEIGPMPLLTYQQARPWARAIRQAVVTKTMPPWFAETSAAPLRNDPRLAPGEIRVIEEWVRQGAPRGTAADAPRPVAWRLGWSIGEPDLVVTMPKPVLVPAKQEIDYQYVVLPLGADEDRWAERIEIRPGARAVVHHAVAYVREPGSPWLRDAKSGDAFSRPGATTSDILALYAPGQPPSSYPKGMAKKIPAGSDLVLQLHYTPNGTAVEDRTSIGIVLAKTKPAKRVLTLQLHTTDFLIPAGQRNHRVTVSGTLPSECELLGFFPHLHLRGTAFEYEAVAPGGRVSTLLRVAPYRFNWQLSYSLDQPMPLRAGTRLRATAWYDNSANNPWNPDSSQDVTYGEQSRDEMMVGFFDMAVSADTDKRQFFDLRQARP
jgi:hypothetical protein